MGAWDAGNFDNDSTLDVISDYALLARKEMHAPDTVEDIDTLMGSVVVYKALVEHCHAAPPERALISDLKQSVLTIYDKQIDGLAPSPTYKVKRRQVIEKTFDDFLAVLDAREQ